MLTVKFNVADTYRDKAGTHLDIVVASPAQAVDFVTGMKPNKTYAAELKEHRERRSKDANSYCWVLLTEMANVLRTDKDSVYLDMLKKYGQGGIVKVRDKDALAILRAIKYYEEHEKLYEENAKYYRMWVGSSNYDTREMAVFIDGIVGECKELGIETATPEELDRFKEEWH